MSDYHGTPIADVPRYIPCIVVYPNGQRRKTGVRYSRLHDATQALERLRMDLAAFVPDEAAADALVSAWTAEKAAR